MFLQYIFRSHLKLERVVQNGLGIVLAGGLGAVLYLQKKEKVQVQEELSDQLSSERTAVSELKTKVPSHIALSLQLVVTNRLQPASM